MNLRSLLELLSDNPGKGIQFVLPGGEMIPAHFHVTEVGRVQKDFIDCGGVMRSEASCVVQVWVANDLDHRLDSTRLSRIFELAAPLLRGDDLPVEVEYEGATISRYSVATAQASTAIQVNLASRHTGCLAPDRCGLNVLSDTSCGPTGCC